MLLYHNARPVTQELRSAIPVELAVIDRVRVGELPRDVEEEAGLLVFGKSGLANTLAASLPVR